MEDKTAEEIKRHFDVVAESLKDEIKLVAEGHSILDRKMDGLDKKVDGLDIKVEGLDKKVDGLDRRVEGLDRKVGGLDRKVEGLDKKVDGLDRRVEGLDRKVGGLDRKVDKLRKENAEEHREILSAIKFSYAELNHRIVTLENKFTDVEKRVNRLEALR